MKTEFASEEDKLLFLKYAIPCGTTLVNRGDIEQSFLDNLSKRTALGDVSEIDPEATFKIAVRMCYLTAKKMGKVKIDSAVVRQYFWKEHEEAIKWRAEVFRDVRLDTCRVYAGRVIFSGEFALVRTKLGNLEFRKDFLPDTEKGDFVITHYDYLVEKTDRETAEKLGFNP
jgi:hypothetical protein